MLQKIVDFIGQGIKWSPKPGVTHYLWPFVAMALFGLGFWLFA